MKKVMILSALMVTIVEIHGSQISLRAAAISSLIVVGPTFGVMELDKRFVGESSEIDTLFRGAVGLSTGATVYAFAKGGKQNFAKAAMVTASILGAHALFRRFYSISSAQVGATSVGSAGSNDVQNMPLSLANSGGLTDDSSCLVKGRVAREEASVSLSNSVESPVPLRGAEQGSGQTSSLRRVNSVSMAEGFDERKLPSAISTQSQEALGQDRHTVSSWVHVDVHN